MEDNDIALGGDQSYEYILSDMDELTTHLIILNPDEWFPSPLGIMWYIWF